MISIFSEIDSSRLAYVCDFICCEVLGVDYDFVSESGFSESKNPRINYSTKNLGGVQIIPAGLIIEKGLSDPDFEVGQWEGLPTIFKSDSGDVPFDLLSAVFYLISRLEEYGEGERDTHDRFKSENSVLMRLGVLQTPIVDLWCEKLSELLLHHKLTQRSYKFISTVDVDNAFAYAYKRTWVKLGGTGKSVFQGNWSDLKMRLKTYFGFQADPYDTYDHIHAIHEEIDVDSKFFILLSDRNVWDKNLGYTNKYLRNLVKSISKKSDVGIHPGYFSSTDKERTREEIMRLADILETDVHLSRQHFLKFRFPNTPRQLCELGITNDYSLGYADSIGFRAGTCTPFRFYDIEKEEVSELTLHSSAIMDATLNNYMKLTPSQALDEVEKVIKVVKEVNGELVTIWHNETLSDIRAWKGWKGVFREVLSKAKMEIS